MFCSIWSPCKPAWRIVIQSLKKLMLPDCGSINCFTTKNCLNHDRYQGDQIGNDMDINNLVNLFWVKMFAKSGLPAN
jgi:hypothetical protein